MAGKDRYKSARCFPGCLTRFIAKRLVGKELEAFLEKPWVGEGLREEDQRKIPIVFKRVLIDGKHVSMAEWVRLRGEEEEEEEEEE